MKASVDEVWLPPLRKAYPLGSGSTPADATRATYLLIVAVIGAVALEVEALDVTLQDVTRPYLAPSGKVPDHGA